MSIISRIKSLCEQTNETLGGLSKKLGFGKNALYRWDTNSPSVDKLQKVAEYFNVSVDYLLGRMDDPRPWTTVLKDNPFCDVTDDERTALEAYLKVYREKKN